MEHLYLYMPHVSVAVLYNRTYLLLNESRYRDIRFGYFSVDGRVRYECLIWRECLHLSLPHASCST